MSVRPFGVKIFENLIEKTLLLFVYFVEKNLTVSDFQQDPSYILVNLV